MIPEMMLCVHTKSGYDSRDEVMRTHKIRLSDSRDDVMSAHKIRVMIPEMMLCVHIKSGL